MYNKLKFIYFIRNAAEGFAYAFLSIYLVRYGFSQSEAGTLMGLIPITMLIATPILSLIDDGQKRQKWLLVVCMTLLAIFIAILNADNLNYALMSVLLVFIAISRCPLWPSMDSLATVTAMNVNKQFASIRLFGSIGYIVTLFVGGIIIDFFDFNTIFFSACALFVLSAILTATVAVPQMNKPIDNRGNYKQLLKNASFVKFMILIILIQATFVSICSFDGLYLEYRFNNVSVFGYMDAVRVFFEVVAMVVLSRINKDIPVKYLYATFACLLALRCLMYFFNAPLYSLWIMTPFIGASFGSLLYCTVRYLTQIVRKYNINIAMSVMASLQLLFTAIYTYFASAIIHYFSLNAIFLMYATISVLGLVFTLIFAGRQAPIQISQE